MRDIFRNSKESERNQSLTCVPLPSVFPRGSCTTVYVPDASDFQSYWGSVGSVVLEVTSTWSETRNTE